LLFSVVIVLASLATLAGACDPEPRIIGSKRVTVGEPLRFQIEQGPEFIEGEFELEDSEGNTYGPDDPEVAYEFADPNDVSIMIPFGVAAGPARLIFGAKGRPEGYVIDLEIIRLGAILSGDGFLHAINVADGSHVGSVRLGHGSFSARLAPDGNRVLATASDEGSVFFLSFDGSGFRPYSPSLEDLGTNPLDAVFTDTGALVATEEGLAIVEQAGGTTVLQGFVDTGSLEELAGGAHAGWVVGRAFPSDDATDIQNELVVVDLTEQGPEVRPVSVDAGGSMGGAGSMAMTPDGSTLYVANRPDNTVTPVTIDASGVQTLDAVAMPEEQIEEGDNIQHADPVRLRIRPDGQELIVLCGASKSLVRFTIQEGGTLQLKGTVFLGSEPWDMSFSSVTNGHVLLENGVSLVDLSQDEPEPEPLGWDKTANGITLLMQP
jgi:YVTN family beta-propeller protein